MLYLRLGCVLHASYHMRSVVCLDPAVYALLRCAALYGTVLPTYILNLKPVSHRGTYLVSSWQLHYSNTTILPYTA